jgi:hypothetical protein
MGRPNSRQRRSGAARSRCEPLESRALLCAAHGWPDLAGAAAAGFAHVHDRQSLAYQQSAARGGPVPAEFREITPMPAVGGGSLAGDELLPDMVPLASASKGYVHGWRVDTREPTMPGRALLRLTTAMANFGRGAMELRGSTNNPDGTQNVLQRVYLDDGGSRDRLAGTFVYHPAHGHIHFEDFAAYHLRAVTAGGGVGDVIASGDKVSFCLLDIDHADPSLPGSPASDRYVSCGQVQGISVGWADVYTYDLADQWIDVTGVPSGRYWLEVVADPGDHLAESDETNNAVRIQIDFTAPGPFVAGRRVFYNNSAFDGNNPAANAADDNAVAPDKVALMPGRTARLSNYTSYSRGINGVMVDVTGLPPGQLTAGDFEFRVGNSNTPGSWASAPAPSSVSRRDGAGAGGSVRVTLVWPDGAVRNQWLRVAVLASARTGLAAADVFYFGNAVGESGNSTSDARVTIADEMGARSHQRTLLNPAPADWRWDFNRDRRVNSADQLIARANKTTTATDLNLITVPVSVVAGANTADPIARGRTPYAPRAASARPLAFVTAHLAAGRKVDELESLAT